MRTSRGSTTGDRKGPVICAHLLCVRPGTGQCSPDLAGH